MDEAMIHARRWWTLARDLLAVDGDLDRQHHPQRRPAPHRLRTSARPGRSSSGSSTPTPSVFAGLLLTAGSLGDLLGRKGPPDDRPGRCSAPVSASAAPSGTPAALILARALMGIGGAAIFPTHAVASSPTPFHDPRAGAGDRRLGGVSRPRRRHRPAARRPAASSTSGGARCSSINVPVCARRDRARALLGLDVARHPSDQAPRPGRRGLLDRRPDGACCSATIEGPTAGGPPIPAVTGLVRRDRVPRPARLREGRAPAPDARRAVLPQPPVLGGLRHHHADVLRPVRLHVLARRQYFQFALEYSPWKAGTMTGLLVAVGPGDRRPQHRRAGRGPVRRRSRCSASASPQWRASGCTRRTP